MSAKRQRPPLGQALSHKARGFTLLEVLVVLGILSVLASLLLPVFLTVRGKARQAVCASHLHQLGMSITMYVQDNDGCYPYAVDPVDKASPIHWSEHPDFRVAIPQLNLIQDALKPYVGQKNVFQCPADIGFDVADFMPVRVDARPTSYEKYGTSYYYRTELAARHAHDALLQSPAQINVLLDGVGNWHGTLIPLMQRYNVLFADGHVKNITRSQVEDAWAQPIGSSVMPAPR